MLTLEQIKARLEQAHFAGNLYQHDNILVLQEPYTENGAAFNIFVQHEHSSDQLGLQFAIKILDNKLNYLIGVTHSNQDSHYEIAVNHLKGDQKAFNLCYAFYNYPKQFYLIETDLYVNSDQFTQCIQQQLFTQPELAFLDSATKINPMGQTVHWMKDYILQSSLEMKVRIQTCLMQKIPTI